MNKSNNLFAETKARRKYFKEWRTKNKDKVKKHNQNFWSKKTKSLKEKQ